MKKLLSILAGFLTYFVIILLFSGYANKTSHPSLTNAIVEKFININSGIAPMNKFQNYIFSFNVKHKGPDFKESVMFFRQLQIIESDISALEWIKRGSLTADVPEVQASVRHFYDPTMPKGSRYLQDIALGPIMSTAQEYYPNPKIDHLEWAIRGDVSMSPNDIENHLFCWENGKKWFKEALETPDFYSRDSLMAMVWRALGETLHMIEDNGCPAHVRDDSHPAPFQMNMYFGDPDPYEELMDGLDSKIPGWAKGTTDSKLRDKLRAATNIENLAETFALWTNENFFTNETISGTAGASGHAIIPKTHPAKVYPSPVASLSNYQPNEFVYTKNVSGYEVNLCTDLCYFWEKYKIGPHRGYPFINQACVESQAQAIVPNIVEAGINAMKLYIPQLKVTINKAEETGVTGIVKHTTDNEYAQEIHYAGKVKIVRNYSDVVKEINAYNGNFGEVIDELNDGDMIHAEISMGTFVVKSEQVEYKKEEDKQPAWYGKIKHASAYLHTECNDYGSKAGISISNNDYFTSQELSCSGSSFSGTIKIDVVNSGYEYIGTSEISGSITITGKGKGIFKYKGVRNVVKRILPYNESSRTVISEEISVSCPCTWDDYSGINISFTDSDERHDNIKQYVDAKYKETIYKADGTVYSVRELCKNWNYGYLTGYASHQH